MVNLISNRILLMKIKRKPNKHKTIVEDDLLSRITDDTFMRWRNLFCSNLKSDRIYRRIEEKTNIKAKWVGSGEREDTPLPKPRMPLTGKKISINAGNNSWTKANKIYI